MAFWYDGNKNYAENKREKDGIVYYIRGVREVEGKRYERYAVNTHFIGRGENLADLIGRYVKPLYLEGDIVCFSVIDFFLAGFDIPFAPGGDDGHIGKEMLKR